MDRTAANRVIMPTVKKTAPPISMVAALVDLFELPSYNINNPRTERVADRMISKNVDILLITQSPAYGWIEGRHHRGAVGPRLQRVPERQASNRLSSFPSHRYIAALRFVRFRC
jgi:hypothetical protein